MKQKQTANRSRIEEQRHYRKVGRLSPTIAKAIRRKSADIYIDENHITHIFNRHEKELASIGFTPMMFLNAIINNFNRVYKGNRNALILVKWNGVPKVVIIELNLALKEGFYEVLTALIRAKKSLKTKDLLWQKK